jgi:methyl-accepting chemotaxis protein
MMNDERQRRDGKLHRKLQVSKDKKYLRLLAAKDVKHTKLQVAKDAKHDQIVSDLRQDFTDELRKSDDKVEAAAEQYQNLKRTYSTVLDDIKIKHRSILRKEQRLHAQLMERKNEIVKKMWRDVEDTREMLWETFNEINDFKRSERMASTSAEKATAIAARATGRSSMLYNKLKESSRLINELKDEINDEKKVIADLRSKMDEYDVIIDCMEQEYEAKCNEHQTKIASIEAYYEEIIRKQSPRYVMKHWVKNKESHGNYIAS